MAKRKAKAPVKIRHPEGDEWFVAAPVTQRQEIDTPWGLAWAEVGTFLLTADDGSQVITTQEDLDEMTSDPVPPLPSVDPPIEEDHPRPDPPIFPGDPEYKKRDR